MNICVEKANQWMVSSFKEIEEKNYALSWAETIPARLYYLCDAVANAAMMPLSGIKLVHSVGLNIFTWGNELEYLRESGLDVSVKASRFVIGFIGATLSPALAYYARDVNILILTAETLYNLLPQRVSLSYPCPVKLGWNVKPGYFVKPEIK